MCVCLYPHQSNHTSTTHTPSREVCHPIVGRVFPLPYTIGSVPSLSGHVIAYRLRSLPRVRWHGASSPQGSSSNGCCLCITMHQMLLCSFLFPHPLLVYSENVQIIGCIVYKYQNISTTAVVYCCTVCGTVSPPRLLEFSVHGTISSYVVFQNIVIIAVLDLFSLSQLMSVHV